MMKRALTLVAALAVMAFVSAAVAADAKADNSVTGTISRVSATSITVTDKDGKAHELTVAKDAKIQCDGKACTLADLDPTKVKSVTVTLNATNPRQADAVDAMTK